MLDTVAAIYFTAYCAAQMALLIGTARLSLTTKVAAFASASVWLALVVAAYALGGPPRGLLGPIPVNFLPFTLALAVLIGGWLVAPRARAALASVPLPALVSVHIGRIGGILFILLYGDGRLSAPFGSVAGAGDIITGLAAAVLAAALLAGFALRTRWLRLWNAFGELDLVVAIVLAALSAPGAPFRLFTDGSGTQALGMLPWILVPAFLVPVDLLAHLAIAARLEARGGRVELSLANRVAWHA